MAVFRWLLFSLIVSSVSVGHSEVQDAPRGIEPTGDFLPANFLKFYLHFSEPMERGDVFRYLRLLKVGEDGSEKEVVEPFREVELWGADMQTLTVWLHPGRQKPGVNLNVDLGPVLEEGRQYRLEVSPEWKTQKGSRLEGELSKTFRAGKSDYQQPDPGEWAITRLSDKKLSIEADGDIDPASLRKRLRVYSPFLKRHMQVDLQCSGNCIVLELGAEPTAEGARISNWIAGQYRIEIDPQLEDLAGNSIARPFNLDLEKYPDFVEKTDPVNLPFRITESLGIELTSP